MRAGLAGALILVAVGAAPAQVERPAGETSKALAVPKTLGAAAARASRDRALGWLVKTQNENGS